MQNFYYPQSTHAIVNSLLGAYPTSLLANRQGDAPQIQDIIRQIKKKKTGNIMKSGLVQEHLPQVRKKLIQPRSNKTLDQDSSSGKAKEYKDPRCMAEVKLTGYGNYFEVKVMRKKG